MAEGRADRIGLLLAPIMGQLDRGVIGFVAVADEGQGEFPARIVVAAQQLHAEMAGVEIERLVEVEHPNHRVQQPIAGSGGGPGGRFTAGLLLPAGLWTDWLMA